METQGSRYMTASAMFRRVLGIVNNNKIKESFFWQNCMTVCLNPYKQMNLFTSFSMASRSASAAISSDVGFELRRKARSSATLTADSMLVRFLRRRQIESAWRMDDELNAPGKQPDNAPVPLAALPEPGEPPPAIRHHHQKQSQSVNETVSHSLITSVITMIRKC